MMYVKNSRRRVILLAVVTALTTQTASSSRAAEPKAAEKNFLWVVKSKTATVYMLGSVHVANKALYPLSEPIQAAFKKADVLALEVPMDQASQTKAGTRLQAVFRYGDGDSLVKHLPKPVKAKLDAFLKKRRLRSDELNRLKPFMVSNVLTMFELARHGFDKKYGIDNHFYERANGNKKIVAFETFDDQINMFKNMSQESQVKMLETTLDEIDDIGVTMSKALKAWKSGDTAKLDKLLLEPMRKPENKAMYQAVFTDRNIKMASKIEEFLKTGSTYFVVVGSGHLVGKKGIVELLRAKKLTVEQL